MRTIFKTLFGSHLYGTATPESDRDYRGVFLPDARRIVLGTTVEAVSHTTGSDATKNSADDVDETLFSLKKFLHLVSSGDTGALDMLFAVPLVRDGLLEGHTSKEIEDVWDKREMFLSKNISSTIGYCRSQASKYGVKGERVADARFALDLLLSNYKREKGESTKRMREIWDLVKMASEGHQFLTFETIEAANGPVEHWNVCNRKIPITIKVIEAIGIIDRLVNEYGSRSLRAEQMGGADWKAMSHALRVTDQALEFVTTGHITFPRPDAEFLLSVKSGDHDFDAMSQLLDEKLNHLEARVAASDLPETVESGVIDDYVFREYQRIVILNQ